MGNPIRRGREGKSREALGNIYYLLSALLKVLLHLQMGRYVKDAREAIPKKRTLHKLTATTIPETSSCGMKLHNLGGVKNLVWF